jgi:hypothetical protein
MRHIVADQDDRDAPAAHVLDQFQHLAAFLDAKGGGRFVQNDHLGPEGGSTGHRDPLPLSARQGFHRHVDVLDRHQAQFGQLVAGKVLHPLLVHHPEHRPHEAFWASCGPLKCRTCPSIRISPWSGVTAPAIALTKVDLPAPLSPMMAVISPGYRSKSAPFIATTVPYRFISPRQVRIATSRSR